MHDSVLEWTAKTLMCADVTGRTVLEVGSYDVNGSVRPIVMAHHPASYLGIDIEPGPGVDEVCELADAARRFGQFDLVICTEVLEHVADWRGSALTLSSLVAPGGALLITTRGPGFPYHPYPIDTWRYTVEAMGLILEACGLNVRVLEPDPQAPGVFALAAKPASWADVVVAWGTPEQVFGHVTGVTAMIET